MIFPFHIHYELKPHSAAAHGEKTFTSGNLTALKRAYLTMQEVTLIRKKHYGPSLKHKACVRISFGPSDLGNNINETARSTQTPHFSRCPEFTADP